MLLKFLLLSTSLVTSQKCTTKRNSDSQNVPQQETNIAYIDIPVVPQARDSAQQPVYQITHDAIRPFQDSQAYVNVPISEAIQPRVYEVHQDGEKDIYSDKKALYVPVYADPTEKRTVYNVNVPSPETSSEKQRVYEFNQDDAKDPYSEINNPYVQTHASPSDQRSVYDASTTSPYVESKYVDIPAEHRTLSKQRNEANSKNRESKYTAVSVPHRTSSKQRPVYNSNDASEKDPRQKKINSFLDIPKSQKLPPGQHPLYDLNFRGAIQTIPFMENPPVNNYGSTETVLELQNVPVATNINLQYHPILQQQKFPSNLNYNQQTVPQNPFLNLIKVPYGPQNVYQAGLQTAHPAPLVLNYQNHQKRPLPLQQIQRNPPKYHIYSPYVKPAPLIQTHIYHPKPNAPQIIQNSPPSPPKYYTNFHPIQNTPPPKQAKQEKQPENEEDHESQEDESEDDKGFEFDEGFFKKSRYSFPHFADEEDEEKEKSSYEVEEREEPEEDREDSVKSFVFSQPATKRRIPTSSTKHRGGARKPKEEFKVLKYTKSTNLPKEYYEGRGSENVPLVQQQKAVLENWYYTKSTQH